MQQRKLLIKKIIDKIKQLPGNQACVDCGSKGEVIGHYGNHSEPIISSQIQCGYQ